MFCLLFVDKDPLGIATPGIQDGEVLLRYARNVDEAMAEAGKSDVVLVSARFPQDEALEIVRALAGKQGTAHILVKDLASVQAAPAPFIAAGAAGWTL